MDSQTINNIISTIATVISAIGIWFTYKTLNEMKEQRITSVKPTIILKAPKDIIYNVGKDEITYNCNEKKYERFFLDIKNIGSEFARKVKINTNVTEYKIKGEGEKNCYGEKFGDISHIINILTKDEKDTIRMLSAILEFERLLREHGSTLEEFNMKIKVEYMDMFNNKYYSEYSIDFIQYITTNTYGKCTEIIYSVAVDIIRDNVKNRE